MTGTDPRATEAHSDPHSTDPRSTGPNTGGPHPGDARFDSRPVTDADAVLGVRPKYVAEPATIAEAAAV
ncbi:hypothetical protein, partial [Actinocorallia lasiicapitis]